MTDSQPEVFITVSFSVRTDDEDGIREEAAKFAASLQARYQTNLGTNVALSLHMMCCGGYAEPETHLPKCSTQVKERHDDGSDADGTRHGDQDA